MQGKVSLVITGKIKRYEYGKGAFACDVVRAELRGNRGRYPVLAVDVLGFFAAEYVGDLFQKFIHDLEEEGLDQMYANLNVSGMKIGPEDIGSFLREFITWAPRVLEKASVCVVEPEHKNLAYTVLHQGNVIISKRIKGFRPAKNLNEAYNIIADAKSAGKTTISE